MENKHEIDAALAIGAGKAREIAQVLLKKVRAKVGY
jgi:tryptophanyl-tRNA synthetase